MEHIIESDKILEFMLAGNSIFTAKSLKTGTRYTYKIKKSKNKNIKLWFVNFLYGQNNNSDYCFIGTIQVKPEGLIYKHSEKSRVTEDAPALIAFKSVLNVAVFQQKHPLLEVWHEGKCARCGRLLTDPESIKSGFGPYCITQ